MRCPIDVSFLEALGTTGGLLAGGLTTKAVHAVSPEESAAQIPKDKPANCLRIALMQAFPEAADQQKNLRIAEKYCRQAAESKADILLMPEMWNIGYRGFGQFDAETTREWQKQATPIDGPWVGRLRELAAELDLAIAATYLQQWPEKPRNTVSLIDRHGEIVLSYSKVHTCDFAFEAALTPGEGFSAVDLDTSLGKVRIGAMICFDREFPESARSLMLSGAEVVLTPNACLLDSLRLSQFQVRAMENAMAMVMTNYPAPQNNGQSVAYNAAGEQIVKAGEAEGLYMADIDLPAVRFQRQHGIWGNAWRKPHRYQALTEKVDLTVFQRKDAYGNPYDPARR